MPTKFNIIDLWNNQKKIYDLTNFFGRLISIGQSIFFIIVFEIFAVINKYEPLFFLFAIGIATIIFLIPVLFFLFIVFQIKCISNFYKLAREGKIQKWIPRIHVFKLIIFIIFVNPVNWIFWGAVLYALQKQLGLVGSIIFIIPWLILEIIRLKEKKTIDSVILK